MANRYRPRRRFEWNDTVGIAIDSGLFMFRFLRPVVRASLMLVLILGLGYGAWQAVLSSPYFVIRNVDIESIPQLDDEEVLARMNVVPNTNIFRFDAPQAQVNLLSHPWVAQALVTVELPDQISVELRPRKPVAILVMNRMFFIDEEGRPFIECDATDKGRFPIVTGITVQDFEADEMGTQARIRRALDVVRQYESLPMSSRWRAGSIAIESGDRLNLMLGGVRVGLGRDQFTVKLKRLNQIFNSLNKRKLGADYILFGDDPSRVIVRESAVKGTDGSSFSLNASGTEK
ncbi:MAG: cell division protein FtsQ/DivIB [Bradymonadia bacterium]